MMFRLDDPAPAVLRVLAEHRLCVDPQYAGEVKRLFEDRACKRRFFRRDGLTVDDVGEHLYDRGIVTERPTPNEILCYLDALLRPSTPTKRGRKPSVAAVDAAERKARSMRLRLFECSCGQKARGSRNTSLICGLCYEMRGEVRAMRRIDPLPEEILAQAAGVRP